MPNRRKGIGDLGFNAQMPKSKSFIPKNRNPIIAIQQRGEAAQEVTPPGSVTSSIRNPFTGETIQTQAGMDYAVKEKLRMKASEDTFKLAKSLPILDDLENSYVDAYKGYQGPVSGLAGGRGALKEYTTGVLGRRNLPLRTFIDKLTQYEAPLIQLTGDVGNFSGSERQSIRAGFPKPSPNLDISRLFLPDDPEFGLNKIRSLKRIYGDKYKESLKVSQTGELSAGYLDWANQQDSSFSSPQDDIQSRKDRLRQRYLTGK